MNIDILQLLKEKNISIKKRFLKMYFLANAGHVGCSLSCAEILTIIRFSWFKNTNDELLLSKGHAAALLYSVLAESNDLSEEEISTFYKDGTFLPAHPPAGKYPKIPFATGSLGHGLSLAAGLALSDRFTGEKRNIYCVASDGELNEGSTWEAILFAAHHKLNNLFLLIDRNKIQGFGDTEDVMKLEPLGLKLESFGWQIENANGHNFEELSMAMEKLVEKKSTYPKVIICNTTKGNGMFHLENKVGSHYLPMEQNIYEKILKNIISEL